MKEDLLDRIRIASPCHVSWESMTGTERARFCSQCKLHVYDFSRLSRKEAVALISNTQGRVCGRLHRRADGTILTSDCPVGLRAIRRRVARMAGACLATVLSLLSVAAARERGAADPSDQKIQSVQLEKKSRPGEQEGIVGTVLDPVGATIPNASVTLKNVRTKTRLTATTNDNGKYVFSGVVAGEYSLTIKLEAFKPLEIKKVLLTDGEQLNITAILDFQHVIEQVGVLISSEPFESSNGNLTIRESLIKRLPM